MSSLVRFPQIQEEELVMTLMDLLHVDRSKITYNNIHLIKAGCNNEMICYYEGRGHLIQIGFESEEDRDKFYQNFSEHFNLDVITRDYVNYSIYDKFWGEIGVMPE